MNAPLRDIITAEIARPVSAAVISFADVLASHGGQSTCAVLFYGSALRTGDLDGVLDFYVIVDSFRGWHRHAVPSAANWLVPPTVEFWQHEQGGRKLRAKVAIIRQDQFLRLNQYESLDTTVWARFAQPAALLWVRDSAASDRVVEAMTQAVTTAARWAAALGPAQGMAEDYWRVLFRQTFSAELRLERKDRGDQIVAFAADRYRRVLPLAWNAASVTFREGENGALIPMQTDRPAALRAWRLRRALGKLLNVLRIAKASFSFEGGVDYMLWKIERHSKVTIAVTPWQRRHPLLASPILLWCLWRERIIR
jgi:hypothetical protein